MYWIFSSMVSTTFSPGSGCFLHAAEPLLVGVHRDQHLPGLALQLIVEFALDAAQAFVIRAHVAEHLRRQFALGIEALGFFLEVNAAQDSARGCASMVSASALRATQQKVLCALAVGQHSRGSSLGDAGDQGNGAGKIRNFRGHGESRIHRDRHGQFTPGAIVDDAALGRDFIGALLLMLLRAARNSP